MSPALYGRPINLYWDLRHVGGRGRDDDRRRGHARAASRLSSPCCCSSASSSWPRAGRLPRWPPRCRRRRCGAAWRRWRWPWSASSRAQTAAGELLPPVAVAPPVTVTYWQQARLVAMQMGRGVDADRRVASGARRPTSAGSAAPTCCWCSWSRTARSRSIGRPSPNPLAASRARFAADVAATGRGVVSAMVDSPTFGGASWLAHVSLMTGVEARDEGANAALMSQSRDTLVSTFAHAGYRTVALDAGAELRLARGRLLRLRRHLRHRPPSATPGRASAGGPCPISSRWPGSTCSRPAAADDRPRFVFFPTTSTHAPFGPTAPYQPDWARLLSAEPYAAPDVSQALARVPDYLDMAPSYVHAVSLRAWRRLAATCGSIPTATSCWCSSAITSRRPRWPARARRGTCRCTSWRAGRRCSRRCARAASAAGVTPERRSIGPMHALLPTLLASFGAPPTRVASASGAGRDRPPTGAAR